MQSTSVMQSSASARRAATRSSREAGRNCRPSTPLGMRWIRSACMPKAIASARVSSVVARQALTRARLQAESELGKIGSNVNQIAHKLNAEQPITTAWLRETLKRLDGALLALQAKRDAALKALGYEAAE